MVGISAGINELEKFAVRDKAGTDREIVNMVFVPGQLVIKAKPISGEPYFVKAARNVDHLADRNIDFFFGSIALSISWKKRV